MMRESGRSGESSEEKGGVLGIGIFERDAGRYIRLVENLPNSGLFWQKGRVGIGAGREKSRFTAHFFRNLGFSGFFGENGFISGLKNYPDRPFWLAKLLFMGWSMGTWKEGLLWGSKIPHKAGREPALLPAPLLRRRLSSRKGSQPPK